MLAVQAVERVVRLRREWFGNVTESSAKPIRRDHDALIFAFDKLVTVAAMSRLNILTFFS